jgi:hypothetical protein
MSNKNQKYQWAYGSRKQRAMLNHNVWLAKITLRALESQVRKIRTKYPLIVTEYQTCDGTMRRASRNMNTQEAAHYSAVVQKRWEAKNSYILALAEYQRACGLCESEAIREALSIKKRQKTTLISLATSPKNR